MVNSTSTLNPQAPIPRRTRATHVVGRPMLQHTRPQTTASSGSEKAYSGGFFRSIPYISAVLLILAVGLFSFANHFGETLSLGGHSASTEKLEVVIANSVLEVPENMVRFTSQRRAGSHTRLELYAHWPTLSGYSEELKGVFSKTNRQAELLFLSIEPRTMSLDMSGRIEPIYSKFFTGQPQLEVAGLTRQPLSEDGGFIDEDLYYEADSPYPFAARCVRPGSSLATPYCIRDIHIGTDLMMTYRFHVKYLKDWISIDRKARKLVAGMIIKS